MSDRVARADPADPAVARVHGVPDLVLGRARARMEETPYEVTIEVGRHVIVADEPEALGGKDAGPAPFGLLVAALGACTSATLKMYAGKKGWPLTSLGVELRYLRSCHGGADRIERILTVGGLDEARAARLAQIAERTPVTLVVKGGAAVDTTLSRGPA
ncbi:OsmC family protein [Pararoseomonas sp. SCSIO 73927]|uniref:OsmC family protein n=1 Tax=Pararoseomonas sp. SCSIO 73927 TaxID=3114537 RepID=UPI0030CD5AF9